MLTDGRPVRRNDPIPVRPFKLVYVSILLLINIAEKKNIYMKIA